MPRPHPTELQLNRILDEARALRDRALRDKRAADQAAINPAITELARLIADAQAARDQARTAGRLYAATEYEIDRRRLTEARDFLARYLSIDPADLAAARARADAEIAARLADNP